MIDPTNVLRLFAEQLVRCDRCGMVLDPQGHQRSVCRTAQERQHLWDDGWVDLTRAWPGADDDAVDAFAEQRRGPGWTQKYDSFGLSATPAVLVPWVRAGDRATTSLAVVACAGLAALRPDRSPARVASAVLAMRPGGQRSLSPPQGFEVPVRCHGEAHRLAVIDGRLVQLDHPETWANKRAKHRRTVHRDRWEQSLQTAELPLLLEGVQVAEAPGWRSCAALVAAWDGGLQGLHRLDLTLDQPGWVQKEQHAALAAARVVLATSLHAMLTVELPGQLGSDVATHVATSLIAPGASYAAVESHHVLPAVRVVVPVDAVPHWSPTST